MLINMRFCFLILSLYIFFSCSNIEKFQSVFVGVDENYIKPGKIKLNVEFVMLDGKIKHLKAGRNYFKWADLKVEGENINDFKFGYIYYDINDFNEKKDKINFKIKSLKYGIDKSLLANAIYLKGLSIVTEYIRLNELNELKYNLILNTGEIINPRKKIFTLSQLELKSNCDLRLYVKKFNSIRGSLFLKSDVPIDKDIDLILVSKSSKQILSKSTLNVVYPSTLNYNFSGKAGVKGQNELKNKEKTVKATNGKKGHNGKNVYVYGQLYSGVKNDFVILTILSDGNKKVEFLPLYGSVYIKSEGGNGGDGGDGSAYSGGEGGEGGAGGNIYLFLDQRLLNFKNHIHIENKGGVYGKSGKSNVVKNNLFNSLNEKKGQDGKVEEPIFMSAEELVKRFTFLKRLNVKK